MDDKLPEINHPKRRIEITESDLEPASGSATPDAPVRPQRPPAPAAGPAKPQRSSAPSPTAALSPVASEKASPAPPAGSTAVASGSYCSGCGSPIHPQAVVCPRCGVATVSAARATGTAMNVALNSKSTGLAILLSLVFTGAGHWYVGRVGRGIAFFAAAFISGLLIFALVGFFILPIVWVWAAIDANKCAQTHNQLLLAQAVSPTALTG
jgi:TM2 domain-containing membrane protein YozV